MGKQLSPASRAAAGQMPYLRVANVHDGYITYRDVKAMGFTSAEREIYGLIPGDILLNEGQSLELVGRSAIYTRGVGEFCFQNTLVRFRSGPGVLPQYAQAVFRRWLATGVFASIAKKTTSIAHLGGDRFARLLFPLLSLEQQRRIVEAIDAVTERVEVERETLAKEMLLWEGLLNHELFSHVQEYGTEPLRDVCLSGGAYGSNAAAVPSDLTMPRYVRITDIDDHGCLATDATSTVSIPWESARPHLLADGDLLIARTGFTTGKSYLYRSSDGICAYAGYLVRFQVNPERMLPEYAFLWTRGNGFLSWVSQNVREVGQRNISAREYNEHEIAVPPLEQQRKLVNAWHAARESHSLRQLGVERLRTLRQAVSDDLLSGKVRVQGMA
ncbi:restriction endonuclease subunit S [Streptomyces angustmyceticus]|nr:hypothetical protein [Streptomyces angustmyceticus]